MDRRKQRLQACVHLVHIIHLALGLLTGLLLFNYNSTELHRRLAVHVRGYWNQTAGPLTMLHPASLPVPSAAVHCRHHVAATNIFLLQSLVLCHLLLFLSTLIRSKKQHKPAATEVEWKTGPNRAQSFLLDKGHCPLTRSSKIKKIGWDGRDWVDLA
jgi:hypothetical protein